MLKPEISYADLSDGPVEGDWRLAKKTELYNSETHNGSDQN